MAYIDVYNAAVDVVTFQPRCLVAMWKAAQDIQNDTNASQLRKDWASAVLTDRARVTPRQLAMLVLSNASIAANPATATDGDIQFQVNSIVDRLVSLG